jgi:hypothetical protein
VGNTREFDFGAFTDGSQSRGRDIDPNHEANATSQLNETAAEATAKACHTAVDDVVTRTVAAGINRWHRKPLYSVSRLNVGYSGAWPNAP